MRCFWVLLVGLLSGGVCGATDWVEIEDGLAFGRFSTESLVADTQGDLVVLRVDPGAWQLKVLHAGDRKSGRTVRQWCRDYGLTAAINAGMYQADRLTHVGYCKINGRLLNGFVNDYLSAFAIDPIDPKEPAFRIFDLDEVTLSEVAKRYRTVVQNLRLIKRGGVNRWQPSEDRWPEAALAEDAQGRALLIYCSTSLSMFEFNRVLLALPLGVTVAQHLEGNKPARMWVSHPGVWGDEVFGDDGHSGLSLPHVLGVTQRVGG